MPTNEERYVVEPLERYLMDPSRSRARWVVKARPRYGTSATGWDLQAVRKNCVLLVEAKYIRGAFAAAMGGLLLAPLTRRSEMMAGGRKQGSWCASVAWAVGCDSSRYRLPDVLRRLLDYLCREPGFWRCYAEHLKWSYVFFVDRRRRVARVEVRRLLWMAERYSLVAGCSLPERRAFANRLMNGIKYC